MAQVKELRFNPRMKDTMFPTVNPGEKVVKENVLDLMLEIIGKTFRTTSKYETRRSIQNEILDYNNKLVEGIKGMEDELSVSDMYLHASDAMKVLASRFEAKAELMSSFVSEEEYNRIMGIDNVVDKMNKPTIIGRIDLNPHKPNDDERELEPSDHINHGS